MAVWADFYPQLMPSVRGCPNPTANLALCEAAREFFRRTRLWREWLDPVTVQDGQREYDLDMPSGSVVVRVEACTSNGRPMDVLSANELESDFTAHDQSGAGIVSKDRVTFHLTRLVPTGSVLQARVSLMPSKAASGIPNDLYEQHCEDIVAGAKHRLMLLPNTDFNNPSLAGFEGDKFQSAIASKAVTAWRGATGNTPRSRVRWC